MVWFHRNLPTALDNTVIAPQVSAEAEQRDRLLEANRAEEGLNRLVPYYYGSGSTCCWRYCGNPRRGLVVCSHRTSGTSVSKSGFSHRNTVPEH
jgi:hypothetical protein